MNGSIFEPLVTAPGSAGVFLDFDGTLSEIVLVPSLARPLPEVPGLLNRLSHRFKLVAVVSGRAAGQLMEWLGAEVEIWGTHGAERAIDGRVELSEAVAPYEDLMRRAFTEARTRMMQLDLEGTVLEDKRVVIGLHFRAAREVDRAQRALDELASQLAETYGLKRAGGRLAYELRPPVELSKAQVVLGRAREADLRGVAFAGDDRVDLPGFDALDRLEADGVIAVRIGVRSDESPPELLERADVVVEGPQGMVGLLEQLAAHD
ncbi:MAG: trehalose-phosphatase [Actinomycetota bacterium]